MRKPLLTLDTFVAALAVLGASSGAASIGCSKAERAPAATIAPVPEPPAAGGGVAPAAASPSPGSPPASEPGAQAAPPAPVAAPRDQAPPTEAKRPPVTVSKTSAGPVGASAVDGGRGVADEKKKPAGMTCGAGMCSADMKKGN